MLVNTQMFIKSTRLFYMLGLQDIKQRYRRSVIGPLWITLNMALMTGCLGLLYGTLFNMPLETFLPFLATGIIVWNFISTCLTESCGAFINSKNLIYQSSVSYWSHVMRVIWRNVIIFAHNLIIIPILFLIYGSNIDWTVLLALPGFILLCANLFWLCTLFAIVCTRYRDVPQIVQSILQVLFFLTPIMWPPEILTARSGELLIDLNPFYHFVEVIRAPILSETNHIVSWVVCFTLLILGTFITGWLNQKFNHRIAYWL